jgi:N-methylhydantoinase A
LAKLDADNFAGGTMKLDADKARTAIDNAIAAPATIDVATAAAGIIEIVDENMANATRVHATDNGDDVESRVLIATGGAAPLHAARIAQKLRIDTVVVPHGAGVGSAFGFLRAPIAYEAVHSHVMPLDRFDPELVGSIFARLRQEAEAVVRHAGRSQALIERRFVDMRYRGQGHELNVELPVRDYTDDDNATFQELFNQQYRKNYSRTIPKLSVEALTWMLFLASEVSADPPPPALTTDRSHPAPVRGHKPVFDAEIGKFVTASVIRRDDAKPGSFFSGPAIIIEDQTTTYVPSAFDGTVSPHGHLVLKQRNKSS